MDVIRFISAILLFTFGTEAFGQVPKSRTKIDIYHWWDYIADDVMKNVGENGFDINSTIYKSNDVAISRLARNTDGFDIAVISSFAFEVLLKNSDVIEHGAFSNIISERNYINPLYESIFPHCLPYLWGTAVFTYDTNKISDAPRSIADLVKIKNQKNRIAIIDDMYEFFARLIGDNEKYCSVFAKKRILSVFLDIPFSCGLPELGGKNSLHAADFVSSVGDTPAQDETAIYGWQGTVGPILAKRPSLKMVLPAQNPIGGTDLVCILKHRKSKTDLATLVKFAALLTNQENTQRNVAATQYFSAYRNDTTNLTPAYKEILTKLIEQIDRGEFLMPSPPSPEMMAIMAARWREMRYANGN